MDVRPLGWGHDGVQPTDLMPRSEGQRVRERLHKERMERPLARLREEVEAAEQSYNGRGEAQVVLGEQLAKVLQEWRKRFEAMNARQGAGEGHHLIMGPLDWLKEMTGIHIRRIHGLVNGEYETVNLTQTELVLMAIDREYLLTDGTLHVIPNPNWSLEKWATYMKERGCI